MSEGANIFLNTHIEYHTTDSIKMMFFDSELSIDEKYYVNLLKIKRNFDNLDELFEVNLTPLELKILHSVIIEYYKQNKYELCKFLLEKSILLIESNYSSFSYTTYERMIYNLSRLHYYNSNYKQAIILSNKGIEYCIKRNSGSILADLFNINGRALFKIGDIISGRKNLSYSIILYEIYKPGLQTDKIIKRLSERYEL